MLQRIADTLRAAKGMRHKLDIQTVGRVLKSGACAVGGAGENVLLGDDCAAIADGDGYLLLAIEGLLNEFVVEEPWFAGYCSVMVNVSDIYAMGGRPIAVVDALWAREGRAAEKVWDGMLAASRAYGVPIVGGHTNHRSSGESLAVAILGRAKRLLSSFAARAGEKLVAAIDLRGEYFGDKPYWNCSTTADGARLRGDLEILPGLAEGGLCGAAKDISMGGVVGTALMLLECSGVGATLDLDAIPRPTGVGAGAATGVATGVAAAGLEKWLLSFPSYGFLLSVAEQNADRVVGEFSGRGIDAAVVGTCDGSRKLTLRGMGESGVFWDLASEPFIGFGPGSSSKESL